MLVCQVAVTLNAAGDGVLEMDVDGKAITIESDWYVRRWRT